jgi:hypothetical protein
MYKISIVIGTDVLLFTTNDTPDVHILIKRKISYELVLDTFCRRGLTILICCSFEVKACLQRALGHWQ